MISRRKFIYGVSASGLLVYLNACGSIKPGEKFKLEKGAHSPIIPKDKGSMNNPHPDGKRSSFGWNYFEVSKNGQKFEFGNLEHTIYSGRIFLRLMIAHEIRDKREVVIKLGNSENVIGRMSVWFAHTFQIFECELNASLDKLLNEGIIIAQESENSEHLYCYQMDSNPGSHLFLEDNITQKSSDRFMTMTGSFWSVQPFGWMEGCVTDGLEALIQKNNSPQLSENLRKRLLMFIPSTQILRYEDYHGKPIDDQFGNWEGGLPFAAIVKLFPDHPSIQLFTDFCESRIKDGKTIGNRLTTEGCYHLAYPLATVAKIKGNNEWCDIALIELMERIQYLTTEDKVFQGASKDGTHHQFVNWARGYAWFLMGLVQTYKVVNSIPEFKNDVRLQRIKAAFEYYADLVLQYQLQDNTWRGYIDLSDSEFDASGTAGIASALMYGNRLGWNVNFNRNSQLQVLEALEQNLTSDGFLKYSCQVNRGGEDLQRGPYRVISQYALGLMAHLYT